METGPDSSGPNDGNLGQSTIKREDDVLDKLEDRPLLPGCYDPCRSAPPLDVP